uniref:Rho GTPase activating protein 32b n=1 Tax=Oncorhynchus tshawytscha TaxID=74940 RepID=A0A8C8FRA1_ONCTS
MEAGSGAAAAVGSAALGLLGAAEAASHDISDRGLRPGRHPEEDDIVPELARLVYPRERPDWEETISAMARSAEVPELSTESLLRSCSSTASMKVKNVKGLFQPNDLLSSDHIHALITVSHTFSLPLSLSVFQLSLADEQSEVTRNGFESKELQYLVQIYCQGRNWIVKRSYEDFRVLDKHLHLCIYDRRFSQLPELPRFDSLSDRAEAVSQMLMAYLSRLTAIADNKINCGPALTWMEVDNKGNHLLVHEESSINVPAIAAAHVIKRYIAQAADELSFEVGDIVSVIDMPPKEDTTWWRGKHGFQVGFFPSECVELINDKVPQSVTNSVPKPVSKKHGKLITFLRTFMKSRPTKQKLKQRGILRERVFGCDLGEHLLNSGHDVPQVLKSCTEFIEKHGVVDGMYRLSGIASNIQKLRHEFDSEQIPDLTKDVYIQDIHCVGSLCKLYFRELPNPLLTYQLYEKFSEAVSAATDEERLIKIHDVIQQLPPPHYRTLEFLMRHLSQLATFSYITNMHSKNLAIVWAPNLLRSKQIESACFSGTAAFMEVRIQSVVVEFILNHVDVLFSPKLSSLIREGAGHNSLLRPKSLLVSSPSTKLLTLEEAQARTQAQINSPVTADSKYIEVGEGPAALQGKFHTVIEFPMERKRPPIKSKKSPVGNWRSFFNLGKSSSMSKRKLHRNPSEPSELKAMALAGGRGDTGTLRSAKSEESLTSLHNVEGESKVYRPRRPRSSSDALSASYNGDLLDSHTRQHCNSDDNLAQSHSGGATHGGGDSDGDDGPIYVPALISPPRSAGEDVDLSPPDIGMASLDFDPMSFQCSLPDGSFSFPLGLSDVATGATGEGTSPKRSPGSIDNGSALVSPSFLGKFANPFLSPDLSPATGEKAGSKKLVCSVSFSDKPVQAVSPKRSKSDILAPLAISEPFDMEISSRLTESHGVPQPSSPPSGLPWDSPLLMGSVLLRTGEPSLSEAFQMELHCKLSFPSVFVPLPGAVASLDSPKASPSPLSSSSVSLLPPPPHPKNAARMLALALAESAQQASILTQKRPSQSQPPTPVSPLDPWSPHTPWTGPLPQLCRVAVSQPQIQFHTHPQAQPQSQPHPQPHSHPQPNARVVPTPSEPVERPWEAIKPVQPRAEPVTHAHGPTPPAPPVRSIESKLATAALSHTEAANPAIFHNILTEASTPEALAHPHPPPRKSSTQQSAYLYHTKGEAALLEPPGEAYYHQRAIPVGQPSYHYRPDSVPPHLSYASKSEPQIPYSARTDHRYNTIAHPRSCHQSMKHHGPPRGGEYISPSPGHHGQGYGPMEGAPVYPTIRRVHSLHVPSAIRSVPIQRTEVPPDDELFYYQRPVYQCNTYQQPPQQSSQADYHVTQLQPYFENGRVQYRYSPYSPCANPLDAPYYDVDPYGTIRLRHFHSFSSRDLGPTLSRSGGKAGGYHYLSRHILPPGKEHSFVSRDMPPGHGSKGSAVYFAWNPEDSERLRMHSIHRESRARQKVKGPVMSQYDNVGLFMPGDLGAYETLHLRSKSDPGKAMLMTVEGKDGRYGVPPGSQHAPRHLVSDPDVLMYMETEKHCQGNGTGDKHSNSRTCQVSHSHQAQHPPRYQAHQQDPGDGARSFQPRYEQPDPDRHQNRSKTPGSYQDNDDHQHQSAPVKAQAPPKPERSHSIRERQQQHYSQAATSEPDRDHSYQPHGGQQRHSTMAIQSHYDNLDDYHPAAIPQPQAPMPNPHGVPSASFPTNPGFTGSHSNRAYSTALGQGAFIPAELALQRPETEIHAE